MGWTNEQATNVDGLAVTYTNTTIEYSTGSTLTIDADASFQSSATLFISRNTDSQGIILTNTTPGGNVNNPQLTVESDDAAGYFLTTAVSGDTIPPFGQTVDGGMQWGPGGVAARDTFLERVSSGRLQLTGSLTVTNDLIVDGTSQGRGYVSSTTSGTGSGPIGNVVTTVHTLANITFKAGRAYKASFGTAVESSLDGVLCRFGIRKTNASGTGLWDFADYPTFGLSDAHVGGDGYIRRNAATDLVATIVLTLQTITGGQTTTLLANSTGPRFFLLEDVGSASQYSFATAIT